MITLARGACPAPRRSWRRDRAQEAQYCLLAPGGTAGPSLLGSKGNCCRSQSWGLTNMAQQGGGSVWTLGPQSHCQSITSSCCSSPVRSGPGSKQERQALWTLETRSWVHILPMPLPGCMTLGKALLLSESPFPLLQSRKVMPSTCEIRPYVHHGPDMQSVLCASVICHLPSFVRGLRKQAWAGFTLALVSKSLETSWPSLCCLSQMMPAQRQTRCSRERGFMPGRRGGERAGWRLGQGSAKVSWA